MKIFTSYFGRLKQLPDGLVPISICAKAPSWYKGLQYHKLQPTYEIFRAYKETGDDHQFRLDFNRLVLAHLSPEEVVAELEELSGGSDIVLLCYEKPSQFCHRQPVAKWLGENGFSVSELEFPSKPQK